MRRNDFLYYLINICFIVAAFLCINFSQIMGLQFSPMMIASLLILFLMIHGLKFARMYFILLEEKLPLWRAMKIYVKATFVSTLVPYKIGELFRMYCYGSEINHFAKGIIAVLIERFFDAISLCLILIPSIIGGWQGNYMFPVLLVAFLIIVAAVYMAFDGTYKYLNRFLITNSGGKKGLRSLATLERIKSFFTTAKSMLKGRQMVIMLLSLLSWIIECCMLWVMGWFMGKEVTLASIGEYISDGFFGVENIFFNNYIYLCMTVFLILLVIIYAKKFFDIVFNFSNKRRK